MLRGKFHEISWGIESSKSQNGHILFKTVQKLKYKGTLLSWTLKVGENKVPLFFHFSTVLNEIWPFFVFELSFPHEMSWNFPRSISWILKTAMPHLKQS